MLKQDKKTKTEVALEKLGLGENETTLYMLMLEYPKATVRELQRHSPFPRTMLYYVLNNLIRLGLVSAIEEKGRAAYIPHNPERLYDLLRERQHEFEKQKETIKDIIPELKNKYRLAHQRPGVRVLEGLDGYRAFVTDMLESQPKSIFSYIPTQQTKQPGLEIRQDFTQARITQKIEQQILASDKNACHTWLAKTPSESYTETRLSPPGLTPFEAEMHIYAWKIAYVRYEKHEPIILITEDQKLYELQRNIFSHLWKQAKPTI